MNEQEVRPPRWGPVTDPAPWPWPQPDPMPWPWTRLPLQWWRRVPWPPPGDPIPFYEKFKDLIKPQDMVALQRAQLEASRAQLQVEMDHVKAQVDIQMDLLSKQMEILEKYQSMR